MGEHVNQTCGDGTESGVEAAVRQPICSTPPFRGFSTHLNGQITPNTFSPFRHPLSFLTKLMAKVSGLCFSCFIYIERSFLSFATCQSGINQTICRLRVCVIIDKPSFEPLMRMDLHLHRHCPQPSFSAFDICLPLTKRLDNTHWHIGSDFICVSFRVDRFRFKGHPTSKT